MVFVLIQRDIDLSVAVDLSVDSVSDRIWLVAWPLSVVAHNAPERQSPFLY